MEDFESKGFANSFDYLDGEEIANVDEHFHYAVVPNWYTSTGSGTLTLRRGQACAFFVIPHGF